MTVLEYNGVACECGTEFETMREFENHNCDGGA